MDVLVTGAGGFVGRGLIATLAAAGHGGVAAGREPPEDLPEGWVGRRRDDLLARRVAARVDAVVHLETRQAAGPPGRATAAELERVNVGGTREWLAWAAAAGVTRFLLASSIMAVVPADGPRDEDSPLLDDDSYGGTKARAEGAVRAWAGPGRHALIVRPAPVYGPATGTNLLPLVRRVISGLPAMVGTGNVPRSVVSRRNFSAAVAFLLERPGNGAEVFNVADPRTFSMRELAAAIAAAAGAPPPRSLPTWLFAAGVPAGELLGALLRRPMPVSLERLREMRRSSDFPADRLVAAGFRHPETTAEGLAALVAWVRSGEGSGAGGCGSPGPG